MWLYVVKYYRLGCESDRWEVWARATITFVSPSSPSASLVVQLAISPEFHKLGRRGAFMPRYSEERKAAVSSKLQCFAGCNFLNSGIRRRLALLSVKLSPMGKHHAPFGPPIVALFQCQP
jgi:hypothetical protein